MEDGLHGQMDLALNHVGNKEILFFRRCHALMGYPLELLTYFTEREPVPTLPQLAAEPLAPEVRLRLTTATLTFHAMSQVGLF